MDLFSVGQTIWRHKLVTLPAVILTLVGCAAVMLVQKPEYQSNSSYILTTPPPPPNSAQIALQPSLAKVNANNPYASYGDLSIVADLLTNVVDTGPVKAGLINKGADSRYTTAPSGLYGNTTPIIDITGTGSTPAQAIQTATLVGTALRHTLQTMQAAQGVNPHYWIGAIQVTAPDGAQVKLSSKLRELIGVLAAGMILMFVLVSVMNALEQRRKLHGIRKAQTTRAPGNALDVPLPSWDVDFGQDPQGDHVSGELPFQATSRPS